MNSAIISISQSSILRTHGTRAVSTRELRFFTIMRPANFDEKFSESGLDKEIDYAAHLASRVLSVLTHRHEAIFPSKKVPWYQANDEDVQG